VVRADNSWVSKGRNQSRDLASYGLLRAEAFREQLAQCGRKISDNVSQHRNKSRDLASCGLLRADVFREQLAQCGRIFNDNSWVSHRHLQSRLRAEVFQEQLAQRGRKITSNSRQNGVAAAEGIELQPIKGEDKAERHKKHQRPGTGAVEHSGLQPKKNEGDQRHQASQLLVKEQAQQAQQTGTSDQSKTLPEGTLSQTKADQQDSRVSATGAQIKEAEPKVFDMTLNDYDDYETDFCPTFSAMTTDDSGCLLSHSEEGEVEP